MDEEQTAVDSERTVVVASQSATLRAAAVGLSTEGNRLWHHYMTMQTAEPLYALSMCHSDPDVQHSSDQVNDTLEELASQSATIRAAACGLSAEGNRLWHHYMTIQTAEPLLNMRQSDPDMEENSDQVNDTLEEKTSKSVTLRAAAVDLSAEGNRLGHHYMTIQTAEPLLSTCESDPDLEQNSDQANVSLEEKPSERATLRAAAVGLSAEGNRLWHHYMTVQTAEPLYALSMSECNVEHNYSDQVNDTLEEPSTSGPADQQSAEILQLSPTQQDESLIVSPLAMTSAPTDILTEETAIEGSTSGSSERYLAESLVRELRTQQLSMQSCESERKYVELVQSEAEMSYVEAAAKREVFADPAMGLVPDSFEGHEMFEEISPESFTFPSELIPSSPPVPDVASSADDDTKSLGQDSTNEFKSSDYFEQRATSPDMLLHEEAGPESDTIQQVALKGVASTLPVVQTVATCDVSNQTEVDIFTIHTQTEATQMNEVATNTAIDVQSVSTATEAVVTQDVDCNTELSCYELMERVRETEMFRKLQEEHKAALRQMNEEKSQRMVSEQLIKIVQADMSSIRQRSVSETTTRLRLENELGDVKGELAYARRQIEEKDRRISELEDSLTGTSLLVRKLEEQNAVSLMSRGGIDYMVEARLAEGRAQEAEQKVQVLQTEMLQAQNEVRRLLDRVTEASREKSEMVSNKVHTQLMQIADEKAATAEQRVHELETEVHELRGKLSTYFSSKPTSTAPERTFSSGLFPSSYSSPYSPYSSSYSPYSPYSPYSSSLSTSYSTLTSSTETKLPGLEPFLTPSFPSTYSNGSGLTLGSQSNEFGVKSLLKSTNEKPSFTSHDSLSSHMTTVTSYSSSPKSQPRAGLPPPPISKKPSTGFTFDLPLIDTTPIVADTGPLPGLPDTKPSAAAESNDSSDWSSSEEEEEGIDGVASPLRPSAHAKLTAQWEWRTRQEEGGEGLTSSSLTSAPPTKRKPPPTAPKPRAFRRISSDETISYEPSSSFEEPRKGAALLPLARDFPRPSGPKGRSLPSRFRKQGYHF